MKYLTALEYVKNLHEVCMFQTREGPRIGVASNSELRRWIQNGAIVINGRKLKLDDQIDFNVTSLVFFPKNPVTLV